MSVYTVFAKNLTELIGEKGITLRQLEKEICINHTTLSRWLGGKTLPQAEYLCVLADYFNCSIDEMLGRTGRP